MDGSSHPRPTAPKVDAPPITEQSTSHAPKQSAKFVPPPKLPIRIEAANFDKGGEGLAFHVENPTTGAIYRQDGVPIIASTDIGGGYAIDQLKQEDWLAYTIDAGEGGWFEISARVRPSTDGIISLLRDRDKPLTTLEIPARAGSEWIDVAGKEKFYLPPGEQILTVRITKPKFQLANFTFTKSQKP